MTIFEALRSDHEIQRKLVKGLLATEATDPQRKKLFVKLKRELKVHALAEERYFYIPLMKDGRTQEKARHSVAEHHELDEYIDKLENSEVSSAEWFETAEKMCKRVIHHLDEEEHEAFQMAGKALEEEQKKELAEQYRMAMNEHGA
jgi:hemerythrin-like domain-containing protein